MPSIPNVTDYTMGIRVPYLSTDDTKGALTLESDIGNITISSNMLTGSMEAKHKLQSVRAINKYWRMKQQKQP